MFNYISYDYSYNYMLFTSAHGETYTHNIAASHLFQLDFFDKVITIIIVVTKE